MNECTNPDGVVDSLVIAAKRYASSGDRLELRRVREIAQGADGPVLIEFADSVAIALREQRLRAEEVRQTLVQGIQAGVITMRRKRNSEVRSDDDRDTGRPASEKDDLQVTLNAAGEFAASSEVSSTAQSSASGRETVRVIRRRAGLLGFFIGYSEEERQRKGNYSEKSMVSTRKVRNLIIRIAIAAVGIVGVVLLFNYLR